MPFKRFCQSCGMPWDKDPEGGGTEADGSKSEKYCSLCYQKGAFLRPDIDTPEKMQALGIEKMTEKGMPRFVAWWFTRGIPRLERWQQKPDTSS